MQYRHADGSVCNHDVHGTILVLNGGMITAERECPGIAWIVRRSNWRQELDRASAAQRMLESLRETVAQLDKMMVEAAGRARTAELGRDSHGNTYAPGGVVQTSGTGDDSVPAWLRPGEQVYSVRQLREMEQQQVMDLQKIAALYQVPGLVLNDPKDIIGGISGI